MIQAAPRRSSCHHSLLKDATTVLLLLIVYFRSCADVSYASEPPPAPAKRISLVVDALIT